jgi:threonine aldolase
MCIRVPGVHSTAGLVFIFLYQIDFIMIDLRSDTVTLPTTGMLDAMSKAPVGDDVFGEDPSVNAFQKRIAEMFGQQAGLFVPSGTMGNQLCINVLTDPGDEVIVDELSHLFNYEAGAASVISGVQLRPLKGNRGMLYAEQVENAIRTRNEWDPHTRVIAIENTTNKGGGSVYNLETIQEIRGVANNNGLTMHLDGARIWNALIEADYNAEQIGSLFDTISVCFSKGLGAPVGSMMLSSEENIRKARRLRKMYGGGMRQVGLLAEAASFAVDHHASLLETDHFRARRLAEIISRNDAFEIDRMSVQTNILLFDVIGKKAEEFLRVLETAGIKMTAFGPQRIRAVFHFQITDEDFNVVTHFFENYVDQN